MEGHRQHRVARQALPEVSAQLEAVNEIVLWSGECKHGQIGVLNRLFPIGARSFHKRIKLARQLRIWEREVGIRLPIDHMVGRDQVP
jgi:hypothetical protein